jgi:hypothetical protein
MKALHGCTIALWFLFVLFAVSPLLVEAQVTVIRTLPDTGEPKGSATWKEPYPDTERAVSVGEPELSGRVSVGGRAGAEPDGERLYALTSDSAVALVQPLSADSALSLEATALRSRSPTEKSQGYELTTGVAFERLQFELTGGYRDSLKPVEGVDSERAETTVGASLSSGLLETLPMSVSYESLWLEQERDGATEASSRSDELAFEAAGTAGRVGLELGARLEYEEDWEEETESFGTGADLVVSFPIAETLAVQALTVPNYNRSESEVSTLESRSLEWGLGLLWSPGDELTTRVTGSRVDAWAEGSGLGIESRQVTYKAKSELSYEPPQGLFTVPSYAVSKTEGGNLAQDMELRAGWRSEAAILREVAANGSLELIRSDAGGRVTDALGWRTDLALKPASTMRIDNGYAGSYEWDESSESWTNSLETSFSHAPVSSMAYRASLSFSDRRADDAENVLKQQYHAGLTLKPQRRFKTYTADLSETVAIQNGGAGDDLLSTARLDTAVPLGENLATQYGVEWEWINRTAPQKDPGSQFRYNAGLSVAEGPVPFSFTSGYAFSHGYRGVRHDLSSGATVPLREGFAMEGLFTLSSYEEEDESRLPFLFGLNLVYEF